jgi:hypothetical protein
MLYRGESVGSRDVVQWIELGAFRPLGPELVTELIGCEAVKGLEPARELVGFDEILQMPAQLLVIVLRGVLDSCILDGPVYSSDLPVSQS